MRNTSNSAVVRRLHGLLAIILFGLGGCGDNASPHIHTTLAPGWTPLAVGEAVTASGVISGLSPSGVTVNGVRYRDDAAVVTVNGQLSSFDTLAVGQYVSVEGFMDSDGRTGSVDRVAYEATVIGPVESLDAAPGELIVAGQTVATNADTVFGAGIDPDTFSGLSLGSRVEVSGLVGGQGDVLATRVDRLGNSGAVQVSGAVSGLDTAAGFFSIGRLTVNYGNASIDLRDGVLSDGTFARVKGSLANGILLAERLTSLYDPWHLVPSGRSRLEGLITRLVSGSEFDLQGVPITTRSTTTFVNGTRGDLAWGTRLTIDGDVGVGGDRITAREVTFGSVITPVTTVPYDIGGFTNVEVRGVFDARISQGPDFGVEVTIDSDVVNRLDVSRAGSTLILDLVPANNNVDVLEAVITMPVLDQITAGGVSNVVLDGFDQMQMTVGVEGVSQLRGSALRIGDLSARVSGVSRLDLGGIRPLAAADVRVSGVSQAVLNMDVGSTLSGSVTTGQGTGTSLLLYYGTEVDVSVTTDVASSVRRLGDTRP